MNDSTAAPQLCAGCNTPLADESRYWLNNAGPFCHRCWEHKEFMIEARAAEDAVRRMCAEALARIK